ncbi:unnamed protein product [Pipistrellus nathusii]|uniref:Nucleolar pre-ribosomal-associated protein 1 n=1 Tax=Pipistrellus nathusii TaxID=59473 RepID=A0ABN9ZV37_PIPNA
MGAKRKARGGGDGAAAPVGAAKRARTEELTGLRFKAQLRDPQGAAPALEAFVAAAKQLPREGAHDVVEGYVTISVECAEVFQLLSGERPPESEVLLIFQALEAILLRTASDLSHLHVVGTNIVKKLLNNHMKLICEALYASGYRVARACLSLMAAMVTQGPEAARDVCSLFDLNKKTLYALATKRDPKGVHDVRLAYIQFALSFLIAGDNSTVVQVLELKEFLPCIFSSGVKEDRISTVEMLLSTLQTKVVHNKNITKTQKVRFFTGQLLTHIASLYGWSGVVDVDLGPTEASAEDAGRALVRERVHRFLTDLCCSLRHGINFHDASLGTAGRGGNLTLLHFLLGLKTAPDDELVAELVVSILRVCPDLLHKYFKEVTFSFLPRAKATWANNIRLLRKIYEAQPDVSRAFQTREFIPLPRLLAMVMVTTVPPVCNKTMFTQALNLDSTSVRHTALALLLFILKRALKTVDFCLSSEAWQGPGVYSAAMMEDFVRLFREALSKVFPDLNTVVWVWQSLRKQDSREGDEQGRKQDSGAPAAGEAAPGDDAGTILLKAVLLQVICLCQRVVPHVVTQCSFDFSKLLRGVISEQALREEVPPVLQHHLLQVALELPACKFSWLKAQEGPEAELMGGERSVFYLLMKMFVASAHAQLKASTKRLIVKILRDTGVFEHTWRELELWLEHLHHPEEHRREAVLQFLERVLLTLVANPYVYTDKASDFVQEASTLQAAAKQDADDASIPISHIDDVLDMVDVLVEGSEGLDEEIGCSLSEDMALLTFPFSPVTPAALEARNKLLLGAEREAGDSVVAYLTAVLTDLLHSQRDPLALCLLLQAYDTLAQGCLPPGSFSSYYRLWIPEPAREAAPPQTPPSPAPEDPAARSFGALLQAAFRSEGQAALLDEEVQTQLRDAIPDVPMHRVPLSVKHVLLCLRTTAERFRQLGRAAGPPLLQLLLDLLRRLVLHCAQLDAQNRERSEAARAEAEADLFLDAEAAASLELAGDTTLEEVLAATLRHPTLEGWFLALERQALPPHTLSPVLAKLLGAHLTAGVLPLLTACAPILQGRGQLGLLAGYSEAVAQSVLRELRARRAGTATAPAKALPQVEALRALHTYMEGAQLREVTLALLSLPEAQLLAPRPAQSAGKERRLSALGKALVQLLTAGPRDQLPSGQLLWAAEYVRGLGALLPALAVDELDAVLLRCLQREPELAAAAGAGLLDYCLARRTPAALGIAELLVQRGWPHLLRFELWCRRPGAGPRLQEGLEDVLPLVHGYLQRRAQGRPTRPAAAPSAVAPVLRKALWRRLQTQLLGADRPPEAGLHAEVLAQLVPFARAKDLAVLKDRLPSSLQTPDGHRSWIVADAVSAALEGEEGAAAELGVWRESLLASCVKWLVAAFGGEPGGDGARGQEAQMLLRFSQLLGSVGDVGPGDWQQFVKTGLKFRYQDPAFLRALHAATQLLYRPESPVRERLVPLPVVHMMLTQHSLFLPTLLASGEEGPPDGQVKEALVDLLWGLVRLCPSVCESSHFAVLLGAYGASLSVLDQKILLLLRAYEQHQLSLLSFRVLLWGPAAVEHHKTSRSLGKSLWQQPSPGDILRLLDRDRMMQTILHFPQSRRLLPPQDTQDPVFRDGSPADLDGLYDPCFLLHLFSELTRPELVLDCRKFVDSNALGLTAAALSSYDPQMRAAAYSVLAAYYAHAEGARFREQPQVLYLLDVVRNGVRTPNMRLTFTLALFVAKAALQVLRPEEHMYLKINKFLLSHEDLNMSKVPGFFQLFYSSDFQHGTEREWLLGLLREGMRDKHCYELYARRGVLPVLLAFSSSPLCGLAAQGWVLEILQKAARDAGAAHALLRDYSLLTWVLHALEGRFLETPLLAGIIDLLHALWATNLGGRGAEAGSPPPGPPGTQEPRKLPALHLVNEFLYVLLALARHLRPALAPAQLTGFFGALDGALRCRAAVLRAARGLGRLAGNQAVLSASDALLLLHKWSLIARDSELQGALRAAAEELRARDLLKMLKDGNKPTGPARARGAWGRRRKPGEAEEAASPELPPSSLETCRGLLRSILTHWGPVFPGPAPTQGPSDPAAPHSPACTVAALVVSWVLCTATEGPLGGAEAAGLLGWLQVHVERQPEVRARLLADSAVRGSLFRLYSQLCTEGPTPELNALMLPLTVALSPAGTPLPPAVETLLASLDEEEEATRASAAFLLSLHVQDVWLGAQRPDSLLAHVHMVREAAGDAPGAGQEPIVRLCEDVATLAPDSASLAGAGSPGQAGGAVQ